MGDGSLPKITKIHKFDLLESRANYHFYFRKTNKLHIYYNSDENKFSESLNVNNR